MKQAFLVKEGGETLLFSSISWRFKIHTNLLEALRGLTGKKNPTYFCLKQFHRLL